MPSSANDAWVVPPPPLAETAAWYAQHEATILECLGTSFPGPHDTYKTIDLKLYDRFLLPLLARAAAAAAAATTTETTPPIVFRVADMGCGQGGVSVYMAKKLQQYFEVEQQLSKKQVDWSVTGVTLTEGAVADATKVANEAGVGEHCRFVVGDFHNLSPEVFPPASFDVVFACNAICHASDVETVLKKNALPLLRPRHSLFFLKDFYAVPAEVMAQHGLPPSVDYDVHLRTHAKNFMMGIFGREALTAYFQDFVAALAPSAQRGEEEEKVVAAAAAAPQAAEFVELGEDTFEGKKFAAGVMKKGESGWSFTPFGEVVLKGFPPHPSSLMLAPFDEGIWIVTL